MQNGEMTNDLKAALKIASENEAALNFLLERKLATIVVVPLLPEIIDNAVDSSNLNKIRLARDILYNYKTEFQVRANIYSYCMSYLASNDE